MARLRGWYGAGPLHLLALGASFMLAGYASVRLFTDSARPVAVAVWFVGAALGHDLVLLPLYAVADGSAHAVLRRARRHPPGLAWVNYLRAPTLLSGLLLLVWFPLIFGLPRPFAAFTDTSTHPYLAHWLLVSGALYLASGLALALRLRRRAAPRPSDEDTSAGRAAGPTEPELS